MGPVYTWKTSLSHTTPKLIPIESGETTRAIKFNKKNIVTFLRLELEISG